MTFRLILTRHAKSAWDDIDLDDHDRVLNARGRRSADAIGDWINDHDYLPDEVLCSDAARTTETYRRMLKRWPATDVACRFLPELYLASAASLRAVLGRATAPVVMIVAHNPGIGTLAGRLCKTAPDNPGFRTYPTAATTVLDFDAPSWSEITTGEVVDFVVPRDLIGGAEND